MAKPTSTTAVRRGRCCRDSRSPASTRTRTATTFTGKGYYAQALYEFSDVAWKPTVSYRYALFNDEFNPLAYGFTDYGYWFQGEIAGNYPLYNNNLKSNMFRVNVKPIESVTVNLFYYNVQARRRAVVRRRERRLRRRSRSDGRLAGDGPHLRERRARAAESRRCRGTVDRRRQGLEVRNVVRVVHSVIKVRK